MVVGTTTVSTGTAAGVAVFFSSKSFRSCFVAAGVAATVAAGVKVLKVFLSSDPPNKSLVGAGVVVGTTGTTTGGTGTASGEGKAGHQTVTMHRLIG